MFLQLPELSAHVWISGFPSKPDSVDDTVRAIHEKFREVSAQIVDLRKVPGSRYLFLAILNASKSFHSKQPISRTLGMEILLYVAANRQIGEAIKRVGIASDTTEVAALLIGPTKEEINAAVQLLSQMLNQTSDDQLVDRWSEERIQNVLSAFEIGPKELVATLRKNETTTQAIERLAIERSAILAIRK